MHSFSVEGRRYVQFPGLRQLSGLIHAFSTRPADVAARKDERAPERAARREQMCRDLGLDPSGLAICLQVHQTRMARLVALARAGSVGTDSAAAAGLAPIEFERSDGVVCNVQRRAVMTFSADCPLILAYDPRERVLGLAHASWRCTVAGMTPNLLAAMSELGCRVSDLHVGVGPSAGPDCYVVKDDVYEAARTLPDRGSCFPRRGDRIYFDLWEANRQQLVAAGVPPRQIEIAGVCTMCDTERFYSFRREGAGCGHFGLMAALA